MKTFHQSRAVHSTNKTDTKANSYENTTDTGEQTDQDIEEKEEKRRQKEQLPGRNKYKAV